MKKWIIVFAVTLSSLGCGKKVAVHPGAISNLDSYAYDVLLVEQDVLNAARADVLAGTLNAKEPLNIGIKQYNATQVLWQNYHANGGDATALDQALSALIAAIGELQKIRGKSVSSPVPASGLTWPVQIQPAYGGAL